MTDTSTAEFYSEFWPKNVPYYSETKKYMLATITGRAYKRALDAGCGHGICSVILSEMTTQVLGVDISSKCLDTAIQQAAKFGCTNIEFSQQDLQELQADDGEFDLVWCWGVAMMAPDPGKVMQHLFRVTKPGGELYLGLYLKTWLSPVHQGVRLFCRRFMNTPTRKRWVLDWFAGLTKWLMVLRGSEFNARADNVSIQAQVDDWYYPPHKTFYTIAEIIALFEANGFAAECIQKQVGRLRSATIFVVKGVRQ